MVFDRSASISACSSTTLPRATLIRMPFGPSARRTSALMRCFVSAPPGVITISTSAGLGEADEGRVIGIGHVLLPGAAVIGHLDVEGLDALGDRLADPAEADDADLAVAQGRAESGKGALSQCPARR